MIKSPKVSIIIPTFNRAHLLPRAIKSVLDQSYEDFELIIADDASQDHTESVVKATDDSRIRYIRLAKNSGTSSIPRNQALKTARGDYMAFQDSDDEWLPGKLEKQMEIMESAPSNLGIVYSDMWRISGSQKKYFAAPSIHMNCDFLFDDAINYALIGIGIGTTLIRKACFVKAGDFDTTLPTFIDTELFIRFSRCFRFHHIGEPLIKYYETEGSTSSSYTAAALARKMILKKYSDDISKNPKLLATHYFGIGFAMCESQNVSVGKNYFFKAFKLNPSNLTFLFAFSAALMGQGSYRKALLGYRKIRKSISTYFS